ncbi:hypothetical protein, partial [Peribacillus sp. NPDC058002]|uniref:hypothetical protein n=1 Tax=Peribacillus sp. NPDC058002 TaxID=3346301 RepID=UPI0036DE585D
GAEVRDSCGSSGTGETPQGAHRQPRGKRAMEGKSTAPHYLVVVCSFHMFTNTQPPPSNIKLMTSAIYWLVPFENRIIV